MADKNEKWSANVRLVNGNWIACVSVLTKLLENVASKFVMVVEISDETLLVLCIWNMHDVAQLVLACNSQFLLIGIQHESISSSP